MREPTTPRSMKNILTILRDWLWPKAPEPVLIACECCGFLTCEEHGNYDICPVCFWEDDGPWPDPDYDLMRCGPNHGMTLTEARANFKIFGAIEPRLVEYVRSPLPSELPSPPAGARG